MNEDFIRDFIFVIVLKFTNVMKYYPYAVDTDFVMVVNLMKASNKPNYRSKKSEFEGAIQDK